ncbi:hypothetical protein CB0940_11551 [Cercospora beticola]|uniref:YDG domain-containing protein n=1 Tax=Cercospora beticola TaxID=122368 RepID=A0A2G5HFI5_CERBT|nr:hypothetical protein CB0940_11551 [Cercospora beticola]PIA90993.1 hypothetical protein CB0940_11551 [Cercospora beticola]WPB08422.1 hypothetical protein RHO25_013088 [Cercospora beticola]CAK1367677.1 unnamed protein product [Cercospora beticola]
MPASEATYAFRKHTPRTVVDIPTFKDYLIQERKDIVNPLRDGKNDSGSSEDSDEFEKAKTAQCNRLEALLEMLKYSQVNKDLLEKEAALADTLDIICTAPAFSSYQKAAQELKTRFAKSNHGAGEPVSIIPHSGKEKPLKYGHNGFTPGDTWSLQPDVVKAGVHGAQVGIYGHPLSGVRSLSLRNGENTGTSLNKDEGIKVLYGTRGGADEEEKDTLPAPNRETFSLYASIRTRIPVRVLRFAPSLGPGQKAPPAGLGPEVGWRYDGLYRVTRVQEATNEKRGKFEKFTLERSPLDDNKGVSFADCRGVESSDGEKVESDKEVADAKAERAPHGCDY